MAGIPLREVAISSAAASFALVNFQPNVLLFSRPSYLGTFVQLFLVQFILWGIWKVLLYPKFFSPLRHLPSPPGGSWWNGQFARISKEPTGQPHCDWIHSTPHNGLIRYLGLLNSERILVASPKALAEVLTTKNYDFIKPAHITTGLGRLLGVGVLLAEGDEHKVQRKNLMPAFAFRHVKDLYPVFWNKSREAVIAMTNHAKSQQALTKSEDVEKVTTNEDAIVIEAGSWASRATLDIIGVAGMGQDFGAIRDPDTLLNRTYRTVFKPSKQAQILGLLAMFLPAWFVSRLPVKRNGDVERAAEIIRTICRQLIRAKKDKLEKHELSDVDILSVALESGGFSEENLVDQLMTFLAAGHETTASAMTWAIYMLCLHPEVQTRLRQEIREKLPSIDEDTDITSHDIDHMPYLNAVCNEILRYYAPVPLTIRESAVDTTIADQFVPKGTKIMLIPWATNKDESLWGPDARKFNPDRWMPREGDAGRSASGGATSNYAMLTFLHGPRSCIGQAFAKAEFAILLAAWIGRLSFELNDPREMDEKNILIKGGVTARPANGMHVKMKVVEGW
ncbi:cytochrome P450 monooxygenase-like protein [Coleophoma cylindrospora]|uniref:Cytochrome P450 monooxygenase-like protein n=1 Tax=Coleophoma cylindrospora TaxID=1849047 RepID=A0A3D8RTM5_9HELO|nr:cytochrome P450 monooxygenase-like protein [Coleophoma cylindrospora]